MKEIILATITGGAVGVLFSVIGLPVPAPPKLAGVMGIVGIYLGYFIATRFLA